MAGKEVALMESQVQEAQSKENAQGSSQSSMTASEALERMVELRKEFERTVGSLRGAPMARRAGR
jgi:hypothetical protein